MNKVLNLLGLAKKAGRLEVGEEPTGAAARARDARLLLIASDAADNSFRRLRHFAEAGACLYARLPCTKDMLGKAVGRTSCAMVAVTDIGFAEAIAGKLAEEDAASYGELAEKNERQGTAREAAPQGAGAARKKSSHGQAQNGREGRKERSASDAQSRETAQSAGTQKQNPERA